MLFSNGVGIDLGTSTVLVYVKGKGIILREPSVVAVRNDEERGVYNQIEAIGQKAYEMVGREPKNLKTIYPLAGGVISDYVYTEEMLRYFMQKALGRGMTRPVVAVCTPCKITEVEQRAIVDSLLTVGARSVHLIEEPVAAAIGAGLDITKPSGCMVVDVGGGTTDIAVISLQGLVTSTSIKVAGNNFDEDIMRMVKKKYGLLIGRRMAEDIKMQIGEADETEEPQVMQVSGRKMVSGLPAAVNVTGADVCEAVSESVLTITNAIQDVLQKTPPELAADITEHGIVMTGGGSLLNGLDRVISRRTKISVFVADDPASCVAIGTGRYLEQLTE